MHKHTEKLIRDDDLSFVMHFCFKELLEKALQGIKRQQETEEDGFALERLIHQRKTVDNELSKVRQQLAESSKVCFVGY